MTDLQTLTRKPPSGSTQPQRGPHHEICDAICRKSQAAYDAWLETDSDDAGDPPELLTVDEFRARCEPEIEAKIHALKAAKAA